MKRHVRLLALAAAMINGFANAQVSVSDAWVRATVPQQKATGAFLKLQAAQDSKLVAATSPRSEEHTSELQSHLNLVCRLLLEKKKNKAQLTCRQLTAT